MRHVLEICCCTASLTKFNVNFEVVAAAVKIFTVAGLSREGCRVFT